MAKKKSAKTSKKTVSKSVKSSSTRKVKTPAQKKTAKTKETPISKKKRSANKKIVKPVSISRSPVSAKKKKQKISSREKKIQEIKLDLLRQKSSLLDEAEVALNELPGQTVFPDLGDQASAETDRNFMLRLRGREQRLLKKIEEALDRIENGNFGICDDCGEDIDIKRLEARPVTTMCIDCKTLQEEEEKLRAS